MGIWTATRLPFVAPGEEVEEVGQLRLAAQTTPPPTVASRLTMEGFFEHLQRVAVGG
jgi:hypothetical protein